MCSVEGCDKKAVAKDLCATHYKRQQRHGTIENTRRPDWGTRESHELYGTWTWMVRGKSVGREAAWNDFWKFVSDVGERPSEDHRLARLESSRPFGPFNYFWQEQIRTSSTDIDARKFRADYMKQYRKNYPDKVRDLNLKKNYGLSLTQYEDLSAKQAHKCKICGKSETDNIVGGGGIRRLAVDHCHTTGKVRGLLCGGCNKGLGNFKDSIESIEAAIKYLKGHQ